MVSKLEKQALLELLHDFRIYSPNMLMSGDGSFCWKNGHYCPPYEVLRGIHQANTVIEKLGILIEAIDADDAEAHQASQHSQHSRRQ